MVFSEPWTGLPPVQWSPGLTSWKMQPTRLDTIADSWKGSLLNWEMYFQGYAVHVCKSKYFCDSNNMIQARRK